MIFLNFQNAIKRKKVVSFDIFDTLIERSCLLPSDVFFLSAFAFFNNFHKAKNFALARIDAENRARLMSASRETTLDRIYDNIDWPDRSVIPSIKGYELSTELNVCQGKHSGLKKLNSALSAGKRVVLTSDMYLPQNFVIEILDKNHIFGYEKIFLSCVYGKSKTSSLLFECIKKELGVKATDIIHIGDSIKADAIGAQKAGIDSFITFRKNAIKRLFFSRIGASLGYTLRF